MRLLNFVLHLALVAMLFSLADYSFSQNQDPSSDHIVVVGNKSQPVAWNHENTLQKAILAAQPNGTVIIPSTYKGTDCSPLSNCSPGSVCVIDWRIGGTGSGNCNGGSGSGSGSGSGTPNQSVSFASALSASLTVALGTQNVTWACWDSSNPANAIFPSNVTLNPASFLATFTFAVAQTGYCVVNSTGIGAPGFFTAIESGATWSIPQTTHLLGTALVVKSYDTVGNEIFGNVAVDPSGNVTVAWLSSQAGKVVIAQ